MAGVRPNTIAEHDAEVVRVVRDAARQLATAARLARQPADHLAADSYTAASLRRTRAECVASINAALARLDV